MKPTYEEFVYGFEGVNPFQLMHISEVIILQLEEILADRARQEVLQFSLQDIELALIDAMRVLNMEIAEQQLATSQHQLQHKRLQTYALLPNMAAAK